MLQLGTKANTDTVCGLSANYIIVSSDKNHESVSTYGPLV